MSFELAFLMSKLQLMNVEELEIEDMPIAFSVDEFLEIMNNTNLLVIVFDDSGIERIDFDEG